jgi:two-component system, NarL family, nitrate/nitrite response regulator NarL
MVSAVRFYTQPSPRSLYCAARGCTATATSLLHAAIMEKAMRRFLTNGKQRNVFDITRLEMAIDASSAGHSQMASVVCVVVHPNRIAREGLKTILAKSPFDPVCTASGIADVPSTIADAGEQVLVLMGVREAGTLAAASSAAKAMFPDAHVVVVGDPRNGGLVVTALAEGATTFIDENVATPALIKELELVVLGEPTISVLLMKRLLGQGSASAVEQAAAPIKLDQQQLSEPEDEARQTPEFSRREAAILNALVQGASNKVIAYRLSITEGTVKVHVKGILRKIRVRNRTQAAIWALHHQALGKPEQAGNGEVALAQGA